MENKSKVKALVHIGAVEVLVNTLAKAKLHDFISNQEAKGILTDVLKELGLKSTPKPVVKIEVAHKKEEGK